MSEMNFKQLVETSKEMVSGTGVSSDCIVALDLKSMDPKTQTMSDLLFYNTNLAKVNLYYIDQYIVVDISFVNSNSEDCETFLYAFDLYKELIKQKDEFIFNKLILTPKSETLSSQLIFSEPIYFTKNSSRAGSRINGMRLFYNLDKLAYMSSEKLNELLDILTEGEINDEEDEETPKI